MLRTIMRPSLILLIFVFATLPIVHCSGSSPTDPSDSGANTATTAGAGSSSTATGDADDGSAPGADDPKVVDDPKVTDDAGISIEKSTNGFDADSPPGPPILVGDPVNWTYVVTNTGDVDLTAVVVTDDQGVAVSCPTDTLAPGESMTCRSGTLRTPAGFSRLFC